MKVLKIGGSILKDDKDLQLIVEKVREYSKVDKVAIVVSATKNTTNELISASESREKATEIVNRIYEKHVNLLSKIAEGRLFENGFREISVMSDEMFKIAWSLKVLDEATPRIRDYLISFGERLSTVIVSTALLAGGLKSSHHPDPVIITDENYGEANVLGELTEKEVREVDMSSIPVLPGFIGRSVNGRITTLGRGGSDYSATIIGKFLGASQVRLITEVPGIMTGDPRKFEGAKTIESLSLIEAVELAHLGAKRLHPKTFEPVFNTPMNVIVEGLYDPGETVIQEKCSMCPGVKGVAVLDKLTSVKVESVRIVGKIGAAATIMTEAQRAGVNLISISQPASETTISLIVDSTSRERLLEKLRELEGSLVKDIDTEDVAAVSAVGCGLKEPKTFKRLLGIASSYNLFSISRGLENSSATFIINKLEGDELAKEIHKVVVNWTS